MLSAQSRLSEGCTDMKERMSGAIKAGNPRIVDKQEHRRGGWRNNSTKEKLTGDIILLPSQHDLRSTIVPR